MPIRAKRILPEVGRIGARGRLLRALFATFAIGGTLAIAMGLRLGAVAVTPAYIVFALAGTVIAVYDIVRRKVPNWMVGPSTFIVGLLLLVASTVDHRWGSMFRGCLAATVLVLAFATFAVAFRHGLGFGDVKLAGLIGLVTGYLSWRVVLLGSLFALAGAAVFASCLVVAGRTRYATMPFAPFLILGAVIAICVVR